MCQLSDESRGLISTTEYLISKSEGFSSSPNGESQGDNIKPPKQGLFRLLQAFLQRLVFHQKLPLDKIGGELVCLGKMVGPIVMTTLLIYSRSVISMLFLGRMGKVELAGGSLAIATGNITGFSILKGLSAGMDPICCQAFGAKRLSILSQTLHKTLCLLLLVTIPISLLWLNMEPLFVRLGQDPDIARVAQVYLAFSIPELVAQATLHPLRIFLRTQGLTAPQTAAAAISVLLHLPITYFLANILGVKGVALALAWNTANLNLGLVVYLVVSNKPLKPWHGFSIVCLFQGWRPLLAMALPSCVSVCLEWWWYEIILFLCGLLDNPKASVAATGILIQTTGFLYVFPFSLSSAISTRVGHALGAAQPSRARWTAAIGLFLAFAYGLTAFAFTFTTALTSVWGRLFTFESEILDLVSAALPILGLCELGNAPQTAACGILTGTARPQIGARINLCSFYIVGLPVAVLTSFKFKIGFQGFWFGLLASQVSCVCFMAYTLFQTDWNDQAKRAQELTLSVGDKDDLETGLIN